jgi:phage terminase large subunit
LFLDVLKDFKIINECVISKSAFTIELPNGSTLIFTGLDAEEKLLSIVEISDIFIEEATEIDRDMLEQLSLRMRAKTKNNQLYLAFNPVSKMNYLFKFLYENPPKSMVIIHSTYEDNKFLDKDYVDALEDLKRTNPQKALVYCYGKWGSQNKLVFEEYKNWELSNFNHVNLVKRGYEVRIALDWGFSIDKTAVIATLYDNENDRIYVFGEIYRKGMTNPEIVELIKDNKWHKQVIYADSSEPKSIVECNRLGLNIKPAKKGKDSIKFGIAFLQRHKIYIHKDCENLINEMRDYAYKKDRSTGEYYIDKYEGADHAIDALRYAYSELYTKARYSTFKKCLLGI